MGRLTLKPVSVMRLRVCAPITVPSAIDDEYAQTSQDNWMYGKQIGEAREERSSCSCMDMESDRHGCDRLLG